MKTISELHINEGYKFPINKIKNFDSSKSKFIVHKPGDMDDGFNGEWEAYEQFNFLLMELENKGQEFEKQDLSKVNKMKEGEETVINAYDKNHNNHEYTVIKIKF